MSAAVSVGPESPRLASLEWQLTQRISPSSPSEPELSTAEGKALLAEATALGARHVLFSGDGALAREDVEELLAHAASCGLEARLATPASPTAVAERLSDLAASGLRGLVTALHGRDGKSHDRACRHDGSFLATVMLLQRAREMGLSIEVRTALLAGQLRTLPAIAELVASIGATRWTVIAPIGDGAPNTPFPLSGEKLGALALERALTTLADLTALHRFEVATIAAPHLARVVRMRYGGSSKGPAGRVHIQRDGASALFVTANGDIWPSAELPLVLGRGSLSSALEHPLLAELQSGERLSGKCGICSFQRLCGGSRGRALVASGDLWAEDPTCVYIPKAKER